MGVECPKCHSSNPDTQRFCGECGTQLSLSEEISASPTKTLEAPVQELARGTTFADRYEFMEELGRGGMGRVYKVFETCLEGIEQGKESDKAMLGMIIAQLGQGKISNAKRILAGLKSRYPDSPAILQAERYIQSVIQKR